MDKKSRKKLISSFYVPFALVLLMWAVKIAEHLTGMDFAPYGMRPREIEGLKGILTMPFLHGDFKHLVSNSVPIIVLGAFLYYFYAEVATRVLIWVYLMSGTWLWVGAMEGTIHIGASGVVYGLAAYLFVAGVIRREFRSMVVAMLVAFLYGGIIWGVLPIRQGVSWEGHLFGMIAGVITAIYFRKSGPKRKKYEWEDDEDYFLKEVEFEEIKPEEANNFSAPRQINFIYKRKNNGEKKD